MPERLKSILATDGRSGRRFSRVSDRYHCRPDGEFAVLAYLSSRRRGRPYTPSSRRPDAECQRIQLPLQVYQPGNVALFFDALDKIEVAARAGMRPMIHFDMHGSISKGLRRTRSTCKDRSSGASIGRFAVSRIGFAVGTPGHGHIEATALQAARIQAAAVSISASFWNSVRMSRWCCAR